MHASPGRTRSPLSLAITAIACLGLALGLATAPAQAVESQYRGLFGAQDPTYNGVDRQSTAVLGLIAVGATVPEISIDWLLRQQCGDGSFAAFREDTAAPCGGPDLVNYTGPNTNSTALAAMALTALSKDSAKVKVKQAAGRAAGKATAWLIAQQQADGGWEWLAGLGSDSTSTAMSLAAIGKPKSQIHRRGAAFLRSAMPAAAGCGVAFTAGTSIVDPLSTSWAFIASQGSLPHAPHRGPRSLTECNPAQVSVSATGSWLASALVDANGQVPSASTPGKTDWNVTALATLGMTQRNGSTLALQLGLAALKANVDAYVVENAADRPTPLGTLLMVAHATKSDPRNFHGVDLTRRLLLTVQR